MFDSYTTAGKLYKKVVAVFIVVTVITTALFYSYLSKQDARRSSADVGDTVTLAFEPPTTTVELGQEYTTTVKFDHSNRPLAVQGYNILASFDSSRITVTHIAYKLGQVSLGLGDTEASPTGANTMPAINAAGKIKFVGEIASANPQIVANGTEIATITYKINDAGAIAGLPNFSTAFDVTGKFVEFKSDLSLQFIDITPASFTVQTANFTPPAGSPTPETTCVPPPACIVQGTCEIAIDPSWCPVGNAVINLKLRFQGITTRPKADATMRVAVKIASAATGKVFNQNVDFVSGQNGIWTGSTSIQVDSTTNPVGTRYSIYIKGPKHLKKRVCELVPKESIPGTYACAADNITLAAGQTNIDGSGISQLAGDLPVNNGQQNGLIDSADTSYIRLHFGDSTADVLKIADLNLDGAVTTQDFSLVIAALGVKYDDPEQTGP